MFAQREVVPYLLQQELLSPEFVVEGDLVVIDISRRNRNFKVISERGPCYLLKQGVEPEGIATVAHEATIYKLIQSVTGSSRFDYFLPGLYGYNPEERVLILELVRDAENLREYYTRCGRFSSLLAAQLGTVLGKLHSLTGVERIRNEYKQRVPDQPPWVLSSIHRPDFRILRDVSSANIQLIKIVQQFPEFSHLLDELHQDWKADTLIHGDIKWDNCLVFAQSGSSRKSRLKVIDWELACVGDPCWDVGTVFSEYLNFWLLSIPVTGETPPDRFLTLAQYPLERMHSAIRAFWHSYVRQTDLVSVESDEWLLRSIKYGGARLVQTAFEQMQNSIQLTGNVVCLLQLSLNILKRPQEAAIQLLGIPFREAWSP